MKKYLSLVICPVVMVFVFNVPFVYAAIVSCTDDCSVCDIFLTISNLVNFIWWNLALPATIIAFLYGGIMWTTAGGNVSKVEKGKKALSSALIGLIIAFAAWLIVDAVMRTLMTGGGGVIQGWGPWNALPGCA